MTPPLYGAMADVEDGEAPPDAFPFPSFDPDRCPCCKRDLAKLPHARKCQPWAKTRRRAA